MNADDKKALEHLLAVSNCNEVHSIYHYLYFPHEHIAKDVADILRQRGFTAEVRVGANDVNWLVLARTQVIPTEIAIATMCEHLEQVADEQGGEYDGWEAEVCAGNKQ